MFAFSDYNLSVRSFQVTYHCYSMSMLPGNQRQNIEKGGKIIMPPSALDTLTRLNVNYPMMFRLKNEDKDRISHAGVLEFIADEGRCYLPYWMMDNLLLNEGDLLTLQSVSLPVATFSKFQPHSSDFLDITNPKAVLENALRSFACLTKGDVIAIQYNRKTYELCVLETRPGNAVSIIECDMNVEFEAPVDYQQKMQPNNEECNGPENEEDVEIFIGSGTRLDGKKKKAAQMEKPKMKRTIARGVPDYGHSFGSLKFDRSIKPISDRVMSTDAEQQANQNGFEGEGFSMNQAP